jgi:hypothetical protein
MPRREAAAHVALKTFEPADLTLLWASEITSFTPPATPRQLAQELGPIRSASKVPISKPETSRLPSVFTPMAVITATETIRPPHQTSR